MTKEQGFLSFIEMTICVENALHENKAVETGCCCIWQRRQVAVDSGREVTEMFPVLLLESTLNKLLLNQRH